MIDISHVTKKFDDITALHDVSLTIEDGDIFGLIGTNGAGKSTLLRLMAGVLKPDEGRITIDGEDVWENTAIKQQICFIADNVFFENDATPDSAAKLWEVLHPAFEQERFEKLCDKLGLDRRRKVRTFSKGMKRQLSLLLALSSGARYIFCDETFDGLDPVMRQTVKGAIAEVVYDRKIVPVIASHNMREIEDISGSVGLLHKGGVLMEKSLDDLKTQIQKVQFVLKDPADFADLTKRLDVVSSEAMGSMNILIVRGGRDEVLSTIAEFEPVYCEPVALTLEEVFISETAAGGYDLRNLFADGGEAGK
jgi:ABC-2 type transport system ATP-binding protein